MHKNDHAAPFDTDECLACHDQSGGHADPIFNRVHAIHSNDSTGDATNYTAGVLNSPLRRDWAEVTYPQVISYLRDLPHHQQLHLHDQSFDDGVWCLPLWC